MIESAPNDGAVRRDRARAHDIKGIVGPFAATKHDRGRRIEPLRVVDVKDGLGQVGPRERQGVGVDADVRVARAVDGQVIVVGRAVLLDLDEQLEAAPRPQAVLAELVPAEDGRARVRHVQVLAVVAHAVEARGVVVVVRLGAEQGRVDGDADLGRRHVDAEYCAVDLIGGEDDPRARNGGEPVEQSGLWEVDKLLGDWRVRLGEVECPNAICSLGRADRCQVRAIECTNVDGKDVRVDFGDAKRGVPQGPGINRLWLNVILG